MARIAVVGGDGIGPEVTAEAVKVLAIVLRPSLRHPPRCSLVPGGQRVPDFEHA